MEPDNSPSEIKPDNKPISNKTKKSQAPNKSSILLVVLAIAALAGIIFSVLSWQQNQELKDDIAKQNEQIQTLEQEVDSLKSPAEDTDDTAQPEVQKLFDNIKVGQTVKTESGSLTVDRYEKTNRKEQTTWMSSVEPILKTYITIKNTTDMAQTYHSSQFTFVDAAKTQKSDISHEFKDYQQMDVAVLQTVTLEPGGSVKATVFFDKYDSQQGTFKWMNSAGQEVRVTLPGI